MQILDPAIEVELSGFLAPYRGPTEGTVHEAIAAALHDATGRNPVNVREGGSIGAVPILADLLGVPVHFLPLSLPQLFLNEQGHYILYNPSDSIVFQL